MKIVLILVAYTAILMCCAQLPINTTGNITQSQLDNALNAVKADYEKKLSDSTAAINNRFSAASDNASKATVQVRGMVYDLLNAFTKSVVDFTDSLSRLRKQFSDSLAALPPFVPKEKLYAVDSSGTFFQMAFSPADTLTPIIKASDDGEHYYELGEDYYTLYKTGRLTTRKPYKFPLKATYVRQ